MTPSTPTTASRLAIAAASGGFKCIFVHGVLAALEAGGVRAAAYAAASASVIPTAAAAVGRAGRIGTEYWHRGAAILREPGRGMSDLVLGGLAAYAPLLRPELFAEGAPRFLIGASAVLTATAAEQTQGERPTAIGRRLLLEIARGDRSWVEEHLRHELFDTDAAEGAPRLTPENFDEVAYASSRMLHAWKVPATIEGRPYIDASYTCSCHAEELSRLGYGIVVAIGTEPGELHRDLFADVRLCDRVGHGRLHVVLPTVDTKVMGVDFTRATAEGIELLFRHGIERGEELLATLDLSETTSTASP